MLSPKTLKRIRDLEIAKRKLAQKQGSLVTRLKKDLAKIGLDVTPVREVNPNKARLVRLVQNHNRRARRRKAS